MRYHYFEGPMGSGKTRRLVEETARLLDTHPAGSILVLASNHARQRDFTRRLLSKTTHAVGQWPVYTYPGYIRNTLFNFWPLAEATIQEKLGEGKSRIMPQLSGLEDTEFLLQKILTEFEEEYPGAFGNFPGTRQGLIKQLVRRLRLRSENRLSRSEMKRRSHLLEEICIDEVAEIEKRFDKLSYTLRVLDSNKQLDVFHQLLETSPVFQEWLTQTVRHLVVDDVDETLAATQGFIRHLAPALDSLILAADIDGGSRRGYLNAYPYDWTLLKALRPGEVTSLVRDDAMAKNAATLLTNWLPEKTLPEPEHDLPPPASNPSPLGPEISMKDIALTRVELLDQLSEDIETLLESGYAQGDLIVVLPKADPLAFYALKSRLSGKNIRLQFLSGTQRPFDTPLCRAFTYLLQLANGHRWTYRLSSFELRSLFCDLLRLNQLDRNGFEALVGQIQEHWKAGASKESAMLLPAPETLVVPLTPEALRRYRHLYDWLEKSRAMSFEQQLYDGFLSMVTPYSSDEDPHRAMKQLIDSYTRQKMIHEGLCDKDGLSEKNPGDLPDRTQPGTPPQPASPRLPEDEFNRFWLGQVKTGSVADTPETPLEVDATAIVVGTPQKIIDFEIRRKIQLWLDVGSREWSRSDNAPLYNAWVHSAVWDGSKTAFSEAFNERIIRTRAAHITRTLMLLAGESVRCYASELDDLGFSQNGLLKQQLLTTPPEGADSGPGSGAISRAILRDDQKAVLDYREGTMAITAVPGAGKTFVNIELILELIEQGVAPDEILVLTYMDSAAKTLIARLKNKLQHKTAKLPTISTIHSLAFRILTENDHALSLGFLPDDMEILDDYAHQDILLRAATQTMGDDENGVGNSWVRALDRGISHVKTSRIDLTLLEASVKNNPGKIKLRRFLAAYRCYRGLLDAEGKLDFTDLILKAIQILSEHSDIREHYQKRFRYIIEDEAQDSSLLLQEFIALLGGPAPNLVRTGDTNQSITTTFSAADPEVFRNFIAAADITVRMDCSNRCAPEIIELANTWLSEASKFPGLENAFQPVKMKPVVDKNPELLYPPSSRIFDTEPEERHWLTERIREIREQSPESSIAILAHTNEEVTTLAGLLQNANIPAVSFSENLNAHPVIQVLLAYLQLLENPGDPARQVKLHDSLADASLISTDESRREFLQENILLHHNPAALNDQTLHQWYYDWLDFSREATGGNISKLLVRLTDHLFKTVEDRSNGYLCALYAQEIINQHQHLDDLSPLEIITRQFEAFRRSRGKKHCFSEILSQGNADFVQLMTLHKAKGQEFDVVFIPGLTSRPIHFDDGEKLIQEIDEALADTPLPDNYRLLKNQGKIEEKARLIYVGITRAKRALYLTCHLSKKNRYGKVETAEPSTPFKLLAPFMQEPPHSASPLIEESEGNDAPNATAVMDTQGASSGA